jgi:fumarate reductase flavoprotein subunit
MEMVQFHPTGLLAGTHTRMTGTVLEEGLRGAGGYLLDGSRQRFMHNYDPLGERATRDIVSRAIFREMRAGRTTPHGGVYLQMHHLGADQVRKQFRGMVERCADCGFDLAGGLVEVVPTAHYMMGGVVFEPDCTTALSGLFAAGEDTGGVHGANRLGGNGVANSTVFGGIAGESMAAWVRRNPQSRAPDDAAIEASVAAHEAPFRQSPGDLEAIREALYECMWNDVGILRSAEGLERGLARLVELDAELSSVGVPGADRTFSIGWQDWLNLKSLISISRVIAIAASAREDSRGAHFREDFPDTDELASSTYSVVHPTRWRDRGCTRARELHACRAGAHANWRQGRGLGRSRPPRVRIVDAQLHTTMCAREAISRSAVRRSDRAFHAAVLDVVISLAHCV